MSIAKIDIDVKMNEQLLNMFIATRKKIVEALNYTLMDVQATATEKGYHFWFILKEQLNDKDLCDLQFLLGDDQVRCRFNYLRLEAGCFNQFNVLFNRKFKNNNNNNNTVERREGQFCTEHSLLP
jgi:hypothetical protein